MSSTAPKRARAKSARADHPPEPVPEAIPTPPEPAQFLFDAEAAQRFREAPHVLKFALRNTAPGAFAYVRPVDFNDPTALHLLPKDLQVQAIQMAIDTEAGRDPRNPVLREDGSVDPDKAVEYLALEQELARKFALIYFHQPKLVATPEEAANGSGAVCIDDIHPADIRAFLFFALGPHQEDAAALATFPV